MARASHPVTLFEHRDDKP